MWGARHAHPYILSVDARHSRMTHKPRHRARRRDLDPIAGPALNQARCTGGLINSHGKRLLNCRSSVCPHHAPAAYASHMAMHTPQSLVPADQSTWVTQ